MENKSEIINPTHYVDSQQSENMSKNAADDVGDSEMKDRIIAAIRQVYDPEIRVNIYDLGLIYNISMDDNAVVNIDMTLTAAACPVAEILPVQVATMVKSIDGVNDANVNLVWDPPWSQESISEAARLELGLL